MGSMVYEEAPDFDGSADYDAEPAPFGGGEPRRSNDSGLDWGGRFSPYIGVLIFIAVIVSRVCSALSG